jgi:hypothetical protein
MFRLVQIKAQPDPKKGRRNDEATCTKIGQGGQYNATLPPPGKMSTIGWSAFKETWTYPPFGVMEYVYFNKIRLSKLQQQGFVPLIL